MATHYSREARTAVEFQGLKASQFGRQAILKKLVREGYMRHPVTGSQTTENQLRELRAAAKRLGLQIVAEFTDNGISGAKSHTIIS